MDTVQSTKFINHRILEIYDARWRQTLSLYNFEKYYMQSSKGVMLGFNTDSRQHQPRQHTMENSIATSKRCFAASIHSKKDTAAVSAVSGSYDQLFPSPADKCLKSTRQVADKTYGTGLWQSSQVAKSVSKKLYLD